MFSIAERVRMHRKNYEMLITQIDVLCELLREKKLYIEKIVELE